MPTDMAKERQAHRRDSSDYGEDVWGTNYPTTQSFCQGAKVQVTFGDCICNINFSALCEIAAVISTDGCLTHHVFDADAVCSYYSNSYFTIAIISK